MFLKKSDSKEKPPVVTGGLAQNIEYLLFILQL